MSVPATGCKAYRTEFVMLNSVTRNDKKEALIGQFIQALLRASKPDAERVLHQIKDDS